MSRLAVKLPAILIVLVLALAGAAFFLFSTSLKQGSREIEKMRTELTELEAARADLATRLSSAQTSQEAVAAAGRSAEALEAWVERWTAELRGPELLAALAVPTVPNWQAQALKLLQKGGATTLDSVVVANARGLVSVSAPKQSVPARSAWLGPVGMKNLFTRGVTRTEVRKLASGVPALTVMSPFIGGKKRGPLGVVAVVATFQNILKDSAGAAVPGATTTIVVTDAAGTIMMAPDAGLVWQRLAESPLKALADLADGSPAAVRADGVRDSQAVARTVAAGGVPLLRVYAYTMGAGPVGPAAGSGGPSRPLGVPLVPFVVASLVVAAVAVLVVLGPVQRMRALTAAAQALAQGATAVELRSAGAKDEVGDLARTLEKLGEELATERSLRTEHEGTIATLQKDLSKLQTEAGELRDYQKELEGRTRREKETLDAELETARGEIETARAEINTLRTQVQEKDRQMAAKVSEAQAQAAQAVSGAQAQAAEQAAQFQAQLQAAQAELARIRAEEASKPVVSSPVADFTLFSEASEALSGEISMLLESVQAYMGRIIESGEGAITDEQQEFLTTVINRSARSQRILGDMRDFAGVKMPGGLALGPVDLAALLTDVTTTIGSAAEDKGLEMVPDIPAELPAVSGDEARLRQVVTVILQNCVRFSPEGGKVTVTAAAGLDGGVEIKVEDSAEPLGLSAKEVFGQFHTADEENLQVRASGLRYPLLKSIMEAHGGILAVGDGPAGGNLFTIALPAGGADAVVKASAGMGGDFFAAIPPVAGAAAAAAPAGGVPGTFEEFLAQQGGGAPAAEQSFDALAAAPATPAAPGPVPASFEEFLAQSGGAAPAAEPASGDFSAAPAGGDAFNWGALPDISAGAAPAAPGAPNLDQMFSLESPTPEPAANFDALAAAPAAPPAEPGLDSIFGGAPSLDSIFTAAPAETPAAPTPDAGLGLWNLDALAGEAAPGAGTPPAPAAEPEAKKDEGNASFGHDEIIQE